MAKRSTSTKLYNVLVQGTKDNLVKWREMVTTVGAKGQTLSEPRIIPNAWETDSPKGGTISLTWESVQEPNPEEEDTGERWVLRTDGGEDEKSNIMLPLNLKQKALARHVDEQVNGTSETILMEAADEMANDFVDAFGIDMTMPSNTSNGHESDEEE